MKKVIATLLFICLALSANAQLLWKISGNGLEKPSYVLGTHHLTQISFVDSIKGLKGIIESAEQTVGELLISDQTAMQAKLQQAAMMPAGESYSKLLSPEDYIKLNTGLKDMLGDLFIPSEKEKRSVRRKERADA